MYVCKAPDKSNKLLVGLRRYKRESVIVADFFPVFPPVSQT